jgi:cytoplasmic iron level regulating protein YaaA (DUF328/UPF0246 family)
MLIVISPAKKLDFKTEPNTKQYSLPALAEHSQILINELKKCSIEDLTKLMNISYGLAETNLKRIYDWSLPFTPQNAKQAILAFNGDVYEGINAKQFSENDFNFAQDHLRIISGLYGILRPLDLIQPYRLPMGTKLSNERGKNLYYFWGDIITNEINKTLKQTNNKILLNLASNEYFKAINTKKIDAPIVDVVFKENKNGIYRVVSFYAKKARGLMTKFIIKNKITNIDDIKSFNLDGYNFDQQQSDMDKFVFIR